MQDERNIGPNIARLCGLYGVSQQQVAALADMSINGINNLVKQRTLRPSFSSLMRIGQVFGISAGVLTLPARECVQEALNHWNEGKISVVESWSDALGLVTKSVGEEALKSVQHSEEAV